MAFEVQIKNIEELLSSLLVDGRKLVSYEHERLLPPGENYGSTMMRLKVNLKSENGEEVVNCVAKLVPPTPFLWKMFNTPVTFKKEVGVYNVIGPTLNKFGAEHGIENLLPIFPEYIGSRFSLDPARTEIDEDAALILKNISDDGYIVGDRFTGFNRDATNLLLKDLATLHASAIALKLTKPDEFKEKVVSLIDTKHSMDSVEDAMRKFAGRLKDALYRNDKCVPLIPKILAMMKNIKALMDSEIREPFATLVHNDFWTNNMMVKYIDDKPVSTKFLDFQIIEYGNPMADVLFLLYSSTRLDLLDEVDEFLKIYTDQFTIVLKQLSCDTTPFSKEAFLNEIKSAAPRELVHMLFMLMPLFTKKGEAKQLSEMHDEHALLLSEDTLHDNYYPRLYFIVQDFVKRGWV